MRIRTQFGITMLLFGVILAVISASAIITSRQIEKVAQQERIAASIAGDASELSYLSDDYLIYRESQQLKRWQSKFATFSAECAALHADGPEQQALAANIRASQDRMKEVFDSIASVQGSPQRKQGEGLDSPFLRVSWSRMAVQSRGLVSDALRLSLSFRDQVDHLHRVNTTVVITLVALLAAYFLINYVIIQRRILKSIGRLRAGAVVIGSGNLDFTIDEKKNDEIGDLARAFNRMTTDLKAVTASKTDLEKEIGERQRAEIALRESEQRWATTLASIGDAVIAADTDGKITFMNAVAEGLTGWTLRDASAMPVTEVFNIINELTRLQVESPVTKVLREGMIVGLANHTILKRRDGIEVPIDDSGAPIKGAGGKTTGVVLVFRDITERKAAEEALRESEEHYRSLFSSMLNGYAYCKMLFEHNEPKDFIYLNVNSAFEALTGLTNVVGKRVSEVIPGIREADPELFEIYGRVALTGIPERFETYVEALGMWFSVSVYSPQREHFVAIFDVITDRKRAEEELKASEEKYRNLFENMTEEVHFWKLVRDGDGRIETWRLVDANPPTLATWGKTLDEIKGKTTDEIFGPGATDHYMPVVQKIMTEGVPCSFEDYFPNLDKHFRFTSVPFGDYFITTGADITNIKKAQQVLKEAYDVLELRVKERTTELQQAYDKLVAEEKGRQQLEAQLRQARKMEALGTLSGGIAHDFNNILAAIIGFSEIAIERIPAESGVQRQLKRVLEAGMRGRDLVKRMLTFSRQTEQEKKPLAVSSIVKESVNLLRASIPTTIDIRVDVKNGSDLILGDPVQIQQVLMNLCTNASYAMQELGGTLDIHLSDHSVPPSNADPQGMKPGPYVKLIVRDTGTGISSDIMDKIFDPFFTTKKVGEGTGLGLSVVHGIVSQHDGSITVESEPGRGSTVYFPRITGDLESDAAKDDEIPTGSERILFVDDEEAIAEMGEDILAELGYEVASRMNGREALALFRLDPSRFDLVVTDQTMPEMTGVELAKEILALRPDMPIIMCTGFSYVVDADRARAAGIRAFAMKPLTKREIAKTIRRVLDE
ncbi:MAG: PAS domain S-box protein [Syntrophorhabdales bacterium]|jgi:PAS domain S-box-containing protein